MRIFVSSPARRHDSIEDDSAAPAWLDDIDMGDAKVEEARQDMQVDRDPYDPPEDTMRSPVKKNYSARKPGTKDSDVVLAVDSHPSEPDHAPVSALRGGAKKQAPVSDDEKSKEEPPKRKRAAAGRKKKVVDSESEPEAESEDEYQPTQVKKAAAKKEEEVKKPAAKQPRGRGKAAAKKPVVDHGSEDDDQEVPEEPVNKTRKRSAPTPPREQPPAKRPASTRKTLPAIEEDEDEMPEGGLVASLRKARMEKESAVKRVAGDDQAPQPAPKPAQPVLPVQSKKPAKRVSSIEDFAGLFGDLDDKAIPSAQPKSNWVLHKPKSDRGENSEISEQVVVSCDVALRVIVPR